MLARQHRTSAINLCALGVALAFAALPQVAAAIPLVQVGNGNPTPDGSYVNAGNLALNLFFTSVNLAADNEVRWVDPVNIGTTQFGTNAFNVSSTAPLATVLADVTIGNAGFIVSSASASLSGSIRAIGGALITDPDRVRGSAISVSVASNAASLQQAILLTRDSVGLSTITAPHGSAISLSFPYDTKLVLSGGTLSGPVAMTHADSRLELHGCCFRLDGEPVGSGPVTPLSGQLEGKLDSGDPLLVSFTQGAPAQITLVSSTTVPVPFAALLGASAALLASGRRALRRR